MNRMKKFQVCCSLSYKKEKKKGNTRRRRKKAGRSVGAGMGRACSHEMLAHSLRESQPSRGGVGGEGVGSANQHRDIPITHARTHAARREAGARVRRDAWATLTPAGQQGIWKRSRGDEVKRKRDLFFFNSPFSV